MITETDMHGRITFVNRKFVEMSGYSKAELLGQPHSIVRHPDMPHCCFKNMWETIRKGETWKGYVKNLRKDGAFYWVVVYVSPKVSESGETVGYIAARKLPDPEGLAAVKAKYAELTDMEFCREQRDEAIVVNIMQQELAEVR
jgi:aerotaxis receptor